MAVVDLQVGAGADDARTTNDSAWSNTTVLNVGRTGTPGDIDVAMRFTGVTIGNGNTIDVAYMTWTPDATDADAVTTDLKAEDADNATATTDLNDFLNRVLTGAVAWSPAGWTIDVEVNTPSIVSPAQTVVNRAGWVSGNAMQLFSKTNGGTTGLNRSFNSYNTNTAKAPKLHIEYTAAGAARRVFVT